MNDGGTLEQEWRDCFRVERFLYREAELLDDFRLMEWLDLLDRSIDYRIPTRETRTDDQLENTFSDASFYMIDSYASLEARMKRFEAGAWSESPRSRMRRNVSNVRAERAGPERIRAKSNLLYFWSRDDQELVLSAERHDEFVDGGNGLKLLRRTVLLDHTVLPLPNLAIVL